MPHLDITSPPFFSSPPLQHSEAGETMQLVCTSLTAAEREHCFKEGLSNYCASPAYHLSPLPEKRPGPMSWEERSLSPTTFNPGLPCMHQHQRTQLSIPGELQPLHAPHLPWSHIAVDCITRLPVSEAKDNILITVSSILSP